MTIALGPWASTRKQAIIFSDKTCHKYKKAQKTGDYLPQGNSEVEIVDSMGQTLTRCFDYTDGGFGWCGTCNETAAKGTIF